MLPDINIDNDSGTHSQIIDVPGYAPVVHCGETGMLWLPGDTDPRAVCFGGPSGITHAIPRDWGHICCPERCYWVPPFYMGEDGVLIDRRPPEDDGPGFIAIVII